MSASEWALDTEVQLLQRRRVAQLRADRAWSACQDEAVEILNHLPSLVSPEATAERTHLEPALKRYHMLMETWCELEDATQDAEAQWRAHRALRGDQ